MNLVEADSRDFLLNRLHRRLELYRMRHEQCFINYQPVWREEIRKQIEETKLLHKRWVEFQAKRTVGKAKNDPLSTNGPSFVKKPKKKLPPSPDNQNTSGQTPSNAYVQTANNVFNKTSPNIPGKQNFNNQNVLQAFPHLATQKKSYKSNLDREIFQNPINSKEGVLMFEMENQSLIDKHPSVLVSNSSIRDNLTEVRTLEENADRVDDLMSEKEVLENQMEQIFMGEDWDQFWDSINRDGDMPKEVLEVLQENETCEDIGGTSSSFPQDFLNQDLAPPRSEGLIVVEPTAGLITPSGGTVFMSCGAKSSSFVHVQPALNEVIHNPTTLDNPQPSVFATPGNNFADQGVIRNNPHFGNRDLYNVGTSFGCEGAENGFARPPSYNDAVSGKFVQSARPSETFDSGLADDYVHNPQFYGEGSTQDMFRQLFPPQQPFYTSGLSRNPTFQKQGNFCDPNFHSYAQQNSRMDDVAWYQMPNVQKCSFNNPYHNDFNDYDVNNNNSRFVGLVNQPYQKMNGGSYGFFGSSYSFDCHQQHQFSHMQQQLDPGPTDPRTGSYHGAAVNGHYWSCQGNNGVVNSTYQKQEAPNVGIVSCSYPSQNVQSFPVSMQGAPAGGYALDSNNVVGAYPAPNVVGDVGCVGAVARRPMGMSVDTELSIIEDIINKK